MIYTEHIEQLCETHRIVMRRCMRRVPSNRARAYLGKRLILTYGINSQRDYFTALHEIGHIVQGGYPESQLLAEEADAWKWAINTAQVEPSELTKQLIGKCLRSYAEEKKDGRRPPPEGHIYWKMLEWEPTEQPTIRQRRLP